MNSNTLIERTRAFIKDKFSGEGTGHDWYHIERVCKTAVSIGKAEGADLFIVELAALLHDIADHKFYNGDEEIGPTKAAAWLQENGAGDKVVEHVKEIVKDISFKGAGVKTSMKTLEGKVVQDADRLDALGAMGIARAFAYGGYKGNVFYDPEEKPELHTDFHKYKNSNGTTINHFYEKLLLLKDRMNTKTGKRLAQKRHQFMEQYLKQFYKEWNGEE